MIKISEIVKNKEHQKIFEFAKEIGKKMNIPVYLVGGYIRDAFLQKDRADIDIMVGNNVFKFSEALSCFCISYLYKRAFSILKHVSLFLC